MNHIRVVAILILLVAAFCVVQAVISAEPQELIEERTESAKFYPSESGTRGDFFAGPVHYKDTDGKWQDIDQKVVDLTRVPKNDKNLKRFNIISDSPDGTLNETMGIFEDSKGNSKLYKSQWQLGVLRNKFGFLAPERGNSSFVFTLNDRENIIFKPLGTKPVSGKKDGNIITYTDAWEGASLEYFIGCTLVRKNIIISSTAAPKKYRFSLKASGLTPQVNGKSLEFLGSDGQVKAYIPRPFMEDSEGIISDDVVVDYVIAGNGNVHITYTPDQAWLADPSRRYPVILDPGTNLPKTSDASASAYVDEYDHDRAFGAYHPLYLRLGVFRGLFVKESRSWVLLNFDLSSLPKNTYIHEASISMECYAVKDRSSNTTDVFKSNVVSFLGGWDEDTVTWDDVVNQEIPNDSFGANLPKAPGIWTTRVNPAVVKSMVRDQKSILIWTFDSQNGYIRFFHSEEASETKPKITIYYSHVPEIKNVSTGHVGPDDLIALGVKDKLRYEISFDTTVPTAESNNKIDTEGKVTFNGVGSRQYSQQYFGDTLPQNAGWSSIILGGDALEEIIDGYLCIRNMEYWKPTQSNGQGKTVWLRAGDFTYGSWPTEFAVRIADGAHAFEYYSSSNDTFEEVIITLKAGRAKVYRNGTLFGVYAATPSTSDEVRFWTYSPGIRPAGYVAIDFLHWDYGTPIEDNGVKSLTLRAEHKVEFNTSDSPSLKPNMTYNFDIIAWCGGYNGCQGCYVSEDRNTFTKLTGFSFDTNLSVSNFDFSNNPNNAIKFPDWGWEPLTDGYATPLAYPNSLSCKVRYATDTVTRAKVAFWVKGSPYKREALESQSGFMHEVDLSELSNNTTYEYQVTTSFTADQAYNFTSAVGEFTTADITCSEFYETTHESNAPLTEATVTWQAVFPGSPNQPVDVQSYLYLGTSKERTTADDYDQKIPASRDGFKHTAVIAGLSPGITYYYRVGFDGTSTLFPAVEQPARFTTPAAGRGAESYFNIQWRDLGSSGRFGVNTGNGNLTAMNTFFALAGRGPALAVGCFYDDNDQNVSPLGTGWRLSYDSSLAVDVNGWVVQTHEDGSTHVYGKNEDGGFESAPGQFGVLEASANGYVITYKGGSSMIYRTSGGSYRLAEVRDRFNNTVFINRDSLGRISSLRRSAVAADVAEVSFYYDAADCLDYILTKPDPETGKQYKVDFTVVKDTNGNWEELKFTQLYQHGEGITPEAYWTTYHMGNANTQTYVEDPNSHRITVTYCDDHRVNTISANYSTYNESGVKGLTTSTTIYNYYVTNETRVMDGRGNVTKFYHNDDLSVGRVELPPDGMALCAQQKFTYNSDFQVVETENSKTQDKSVLTHFQYDDKGNLQQIVEDYGGTDILTKDNTTVFTYEPKYNQIQTITDPRQYNSDPNVVSTEYVYDPVTGMLKWVEPRGSSVFEPANYRIEYDYYSNYDLRYKKVYNTNTEYANSLPTVIFEYGYDSFGQLEEVIYYDGTQPKLIGFYRRDMFGNLLYNVDANGTITEIEYNGRLLPTGEKRPMKADATTLAVVNNYLARFNYSLAQLGESELPEPTPNYTYSQQITYDDLGRPETVTDARNNVTTNEYDELNRLLKVTAPLDLTTYYHYDGNGNLEWKRYSVQNGYAVVRHSYDALNRETSSYDPAIGRDREFRVEFDLAGNTEVLYRGWNDDGTFLSKEVYSYDNLNRCTEVKYYDGGNNFKKSVTTEYDRNGNATKVISPVFAPEGVNDGSLLRTQSFDAINRLISETVSNSSNSRYNYTASYAYGGGRLLSETLSGVTTNYTYDTGGRLDTLSSAGKQFGFEYYPNGIRQQMQYEKNGTTVMTVSYGFDRAYRLLNMNYSWGAAQMGMGFAYTYYEDGTVHTATETGTGVNVTGLTFVDNNDVALETEAAKKYQYPSPNQLFGGTRIATYEYDALGRLVEAALPRYCNGVPDKVTTWEYDAIGNRNRETAVEGSYQNGPSNTIESTSISTSYLYDPFSGNRTVSGTRTTVTNYAFGTDPSTVSTPLIYEYDALGNLVSQSTKEKNEDGFFVIKPSTTSWFNELWRVSRQTNYDENEDPETVNYYSDSRGIQIREDNLYYFHNSNGVSRIFDAASSTTHNYVRYGGQVLSSSDGFFYIVNARGDVVALVSETDGSVVGYYTYDAFGGLRATQKDVGKFNKFKFAGGLQSATGNYVFGARLYSPGEGRWISLDGYRGSAGDPLSLNRYAYCSNDPVNYVDPSGYSKTIVGQVTSTRVVVKPTVAQNYLLARKCKNTAISIFFGAISLIGAYLDPLGGLFLGFAALAEMKASTDRLNNFECVIDCGEYTLTATEYRVESEYGTGNLTIYTVTVYDENNKATTMELSKEEYDLLNNISVETS
jgi:RHS repeat-associated protein